MSINRRPLVQKVIEAGNPHKWWDKIKPVSKRTYRERETRLKLDLADTILQIDNLKKELRKHNIDIPAIENKTEQIVEMVIEDNKEIEWDFAMDKYEERIEAYRNGRILEKIRSLFDPPFNPEEPEETPTPTEEEPDESYVNPSEEKLSQLIDSIENKGGVDHATREEKEALSSILQEISEYAVDSTPSPQS